MTKCCVNPQKRLVDWKRVRTVINKTYYCENCTKTFTEFSFSDIVSKSSSE